MTVTSRAVHRFDAAERQVYQTAIRLNELHPGGIDLPMLAESLGCDLEAAARWLAWLRETGDFLPVAPSAGR